MSTGNNSDSFEYKSITELDSTPEGHVSPLRRPIQHPYGTIGDKPGVQRPNTTSASKYATPPQRRRASRQVPAVIMPGNGSPSAQGRFGTSTHPLLVFGTMNTTTSALLASKNSPAASMPTRQPSKKDPVVPPDYPYSMDTMTPEWRAQYFAASMERMLGSAAPDTHSLVIGAGNGSQVRTGSIQADSCGGRESEQTATRPGELTQEEKEARRARFKQEVTRARLDSEDLDKEMSKDLLG